jgi:hypothetical protein
MARQFKATLNGKSFDNLHVYANALEKAVKEGIIIETQFSINDSNGSSVVPIDECENAPEPKKLKSIKKYLPFSDEILQSEYIDLIFDAPGEESRSERIDYIDWENEKLYEAVCEAVGHNSKEQLNTYLKDVERVLDKLTVDIDILEGITEGVKEDYETAIEKYEEAKANLKLAEEKFNDEHECLVKYRDSIRLSKTLAHFYNSVRRCILGEFYIRKA